MQSRKKPLKTPPRSWRQREDLVQVRRSAAFFDAMIWMKLSVWVKCDGAKRPWGRGVFRHLPWGKVLTPRLPRGVDFPTLFWARAAPQGGPAKITGVPELDPTLPTEDPRLRRRGAVVVAMKVPWGNKLRNRVYTIYTIA